MTESALQLGLLPQTWPTIVTDFPWAYGDSNARGGVDKHYKTLSTARLMALPIRDLAWSNSHLWCWVTNSFMEDGLRLMRAYGFEFKTILTWDKQRIGNGHYLRSRTEHVLFGTRGRAPMLNKSTPTIFTAPRGEHSEKPDYFYRLVEACSPGPYLSLFDRKPRGPAWSLWGDQAEGGISLPALEKAVAA